MYFNLKFLPLYHLNSVFIRRSLQILNSQICLSFPQLHRSSPSPLLPSRLPLREFIWSVFLVVLTGAPNTRANKPIQFNNGGFPTPGLCLGVNSNAVGGQAVAFGCGPNDGAKQSNPLARSWTLSAGGSSNGIGAPTSISIYGNLCRFCGRMTLPFKRIHAIKVTATNSGT